MGEDKIAYRDILSLAEDRLRELTAETELSDYVDDEFVRGAVQRLYGIFGVTNGNGLRKEDVVRFCEQYVAIWQDADDAIFARAHQEGRDFERHGGSGLPEYFDDGLDDFGGED